MKKQNYQVRDDEVIEQFLQRRERGQLGSEGLNFSWSNWGFGIEAFSKSMERLSSNNVRFVELHGNRYGPDLGYKSSEIRPILSDHGIQVSGVCGMVSPESELSSNKPHVRQRSIDYFRRQIDMCSELGGTYILFAPGAVGRPEAPDQYEFERAAETIHIIAEDFHQAGIRGAIEPVRAAEVSFCHTFAEAKKLIDMIDHPGVAHVAGDVYHMLAGEEHIGETLLEYGHLLTNLHLADSNRLALGRGSLDLDVILMALYAVGYNNPSCFCSAEPLGPGGDPYPQKHGKHSKAFLDDLVSQTARYFTEREEEILSVDAEELRR